MGKHGWTLSENVLNGKLIRFTSGRFHDIAWVQAKDDFPRGVIAGALENGALDLWNAEKLLNGDG